VGDAVGDRWPDLVTEVEGIAAGARVPAETLLAVNARTELLGGAECTLIGRLEGGSCTVAQNWDWHPDLEPFVWVVEQPGGRWFATRTEAGMLAKIGLSSARLCCGLNFLRCSVDGSTGGVPIHVLLRVLLDRVDTVDDGLALLAGVAVDASSCITLGWSDGLVAVELSPGGWELVWPDGDRLVHTNHFLAGPVAGDDLEAAEDPSTFLRRWVVERTGSLCSHVGPVCRHERPGEPWADRRATLASVVMEPAVPRLRVADGPPCERPLREVALP
jgi:isopenicillin-N N-acyltransferase-like protein